MYNNMLLQTNIPPLHCTLLFSNMNTLPLIITSMYKLTRPKFDHNVLCVCTTCGSTHIIVRMCWRTSAMFSVNNIDQKIYVNFMISAQPTTPLQLPPSHTLIHCTCLKTIFNSILCTRTLYTHAHVLSYWAEGPIHNTLICMYSCTCVLYILYCIYTLYM